MNRKSPSAVKQLKYNCYPILIVLYNMCLDFGRSAFSTYIAGDSKTGLSLLYYYMCQDYVRSELSLQRWTSNYFFLIFQRFSICNDVALQGWWVSQSQQQKARFQVMTLRQSPRWLIEATSSLQIHFSSFIIIMKTSVKSMANCIANFAKCCFYHPFLSFLSFLWHKLKK